MFALLKKWFLPRDSNENTQLMPEALFHVAVTDEGIETQRPDGKNERVELANLAAVIIETNDTGPWGTDVWWILVGKDGRQGCVFPEGATGEGEVLTRLQELPGFDNEAFIRAMGCTDNARFVCWKSPVHVAWKTRELV